MDMTKEDLSAVASEGVNSRSTRIRLIAYGIAWGLCLGWFVIGVPRIEAIFKDFC
jgi:hypothetical protein